MKHETSLHHSAAAEERDLTPELFVLSARLIRLPDYSGEKEQDSRRAARLGWKHTAPRPTPLVRCGNARVPSKSQEVKNKLHLSQLAQMKCW